MRLTSIFTTEAQDNNYKELKKDHVADRGMMDSDECCIYCGKRRSGKTGCCGENHWEQVPEDEISEAVIVELSNKTMASYVDKAAEDAVDSRSRGTGKLLDPSYDYAKDGGTEDDRRADKRLDGIKLAAKKLGRKHLSEKWYVITPQKVRIGKGHDSEDSALGYWKSISPKLRQGLKIVHEALDVVHESQWAIVTPTGTTVGSTHPSEAAALIQFKKISDKQRTGLKIVEKKTYYIVTPTGTKVGAAHSSHQDALDYWKKISEKNRTGLKIVAESVIDTNTDSTEFKQGYNYRKNYKQLHADRGTAQPNHNPYDTGTTACMDWKAGFQAFSADSNLHEDDTMSDVLRGRDIINTGDSDSYQKFLSKIRDTHGDKYSTEVHNMIKSNSKTMALGNK